MSGARSGGKRKRSNANGAAAVPAPIDYQSIIASLPAQTQCNILIRAAQQHSDVAASLVNERDRVRAAEQARAIDFDHYSKSVWRKLNASYYGRLSGSQQYEKAFDVVSEVEEDINAIGGATTAHASFGTKKSALETLRKIGKSISMCEGDTLQSEVIKQFQYNECLESTMLRIAKSMAVQERKALATKEFVDKLVELESLGADRCIFENLRDVRFTLLGAQEYSAAGGRELEGWE